MSGLHYEIAPEIFERFPGYVRGVVVAHGVGNGPAPEVLVAMLREAETSVRERPGIRWEDCFPNGGVSQRDSRIRIVSAESIFGPEASWEARHEELCAATSESPEA
jgi:hypothetical protein